MDHLQLEQDLAFVRRVVESNQRAARVDVWPLLVWGVLTAVGAGSTYLAPATDTVWLWVVVIGLAWIYTAWRLVRRDPAGSSHVFAHRVLLVLWGSMLGTMTLIGFGGYFAGVLTATAIPPIVSALFGAAFLASSGLLQQRGIAMLGLLWWLSAVGLFLLPASLRLGGFGVAVVLWLVLPLIVVLRNAIRQ